MAVLSACAGVLGRHGRHAGTAVGTLDKLPPGSGLRASLGGDESTIVVNVDGDVRAFRAVCTHEGCPLGWNAQQHLIRCPCHFQCQYHFLCQYQYHFQCQCQCHFRYHRRRCPTCRNR